MQGLGPARRILVKPQVHMGFGWFCTAKASRNHAESCYELLDMEECCGMPSGFRAGVHGIVDLCSWGLPWGLGTAELGRRPNFSKPLWPWSRTSVIIIIITIIIIIIIITIIMIIIIIRIII